MSENDKKGTGLAAIASAPTDIALLLAEVRRLQCCGNCNHFDLGHDGMHIEPQCKLTTYYLEPWQKCDKWEAAGNG